jgi:hypothetical protein
VECSRSQPGYDAQERASADVEPSAAVWREEALAYLARFSPSYPECKRWGIDHLLVTVRHTNPALWAKARDAGFWERRP